MSEKLKPCPFCGCKNVELYEWADTGHFSVQCNNKDCSIWTCAWPEDAITKTWNRRTKETS